MQHGVPLHGLRARWMIKGFLFASCLSRSDEYARAACTDVGPHVDAVPNWNAVPHSDVAPHDDVEW